MNVCKNCNVRLSKKQLVYCGNSCQLNYQYQDYIDRWKSGHASGSRGVLAKNVSAYITRYVRAKYENKCSRCGWSEENPFTCTVHLEIEHIDGNSENNSEDNLTLLCPNCHSLTKSYKNHNRGNGRSWRRHKYTKNS